MSQTKKIVLFVIVPLIASCCLLCVVVGVVLPGMMSQSFSADPAKAKAVGAQIADYVLPPGYQEEMSMDLFFEQMVELAPPDKSGVSITLFQIKGANYNSQQMQQQMQQAMQNQFQRKSAGMTFVGTRAVQIKGQPTTLSISESQGATAGSREAFGMFQGKGGQAMVMLTGSTGDWNWDTLDAFFQSIK